MQKSCKITAKRKTGISDFKFECGKMLIIKFCQHGSNFRQKFQAVLEYEFRESCKNIPLPPLSKDEGLNKIEHSMSIKNLIFGVNSVTVSDLIRYDSLLQNATDVITKCDSSVITKCDSYYKMRRLLQIATVQSARNQSKVESLNGN